MITTRSLLLLLLCALSAGMPTNAADEPDPVQHEVVSFGSAWIAVPKGWRTLTPTPRMLMYRHGDGIGIPALDETENPLQIGLVVEKFPHVSQSVDEVLRALIAGAKADDSLEAVGTEDVTTIKLADGTEAMLLKLQFIKERSRRSLQLKLLTKDADQNIWMVSAHLVGGKESSWPKADSPLATWLEAHVTSFTFDENKLDARNIKAAYESLGRK